MSIKNYIVATSGHIDHGKTALVKALTNTDCDTHRQEKERGITISLGFANLKYDNDISVSIIDVPGHRDFINTMISGVSCVKLALLVIAADSGIMPQTKEHLKILEVLGIKNIFFIFTKIDLVDPIMLEMAKEELGTFISGSFIENAPIFCVSSITKSGISDLKNAIKESLLSIKESHFYRSTDSFFRNYVDRSFSLAGHGIIVAGSIIDGHITTRDTIYILKDSVVEEAKIKGIQICGVETESASFNNRVAINVKTNIDASSLKGSLISSVVLHSSTMIDVEISMFSSGDKKMVKNDEYANKTIFVDFLIGTIVRQTKIRFLFKRSDDIYFAQIYFSLPIHVKYGDRFIIRNSSGDKSLGGGKIIDINPLKHIKRSDNLLFSLMNLSSGDLADIIYNEVSKNNGIIGIKELLEKTNFSITELSSVKECLKMISIKNGRDITCFVQKSIYDEHLQLIPKMIRRKHTSFPLSNCGLTFEEIIRGLSIEPNTVSRVYIEFVINNLVFTKTLSKHMDGWILYGHIPTIDEKTLADIKFVEELFKKYELTTPNMSEIEEKVYSNSIDKKPFDQILTHLVSQKKIYRIEDTYIHSNVVNNGRSQIISYLKENKDGINVASFRDLINGNRKICLLLLAIYDREKVTIRNGDYRFLYPKV